MGQLDNEYNKFRNVEKSEFHSRHKITDLFHDDCNYGDWFASLPMLPLEGDEEKVKRGKGL